MWQFLLILYLFWNTIFKSPTVTTNSIDFPVLFHYCKFTHESRGNLMSRTVKSGGKLKSLFLPNKVVKNHLSCFHRENCQMIWFCSPFLPHNLPSVTKFAHVCVLRWHIVLQVGVCIMIYDGYWTVDYDWLWSMWISQREV